MIIDLTGKTALITGSTQGIGYAIAAVRVDGGYIDAIIP
jgi:NAD(P)-dependent dehydrogenase (short-subunit alcohol dehydrogenase family)